MQKFSVKPYRRKDGFVMLYVNNNENRVSLGIAEDVKTSKITAGQKKILAEFERAIANTATIATNFKSNSQTSILNSGYLKFFAVDDGRIDDLHVECDGGYLLTSDGRLLRLSDVVDTMNGGVQ